MLFCQPHMPFPCYFSVSPLDVCRNAWTSISTYAGSFSAKDLQFVSRSTYIGLKILGCGTTVKLAKKAVQFASYERASQNFKRNNFKIITLSEVGALLNSNAGQRKIITQFLTAGLVTEQALLIFCAMGVISPAAVGLIIGINCFLKFTKNTLNINDAVMTGHKAWSCHESKKTVQWKSKCGIALGKTMILTAKTFKVFETPRDLLALGITSYSYISGKYYGSKNAKADTKTQNTRNMETARSETQKINASKSSNGNSVKGSLLHTLACTAVLCGA